MGDPGDSILFVMRDKRQERLDRAIRREDLQDLVDVDRVEYARSQVKLAESFAEVERCAHFVYEGCTNVGQWGEKHGFSSLASVTLAAAGNAFALEAEVKARVLDGRLTIEAAATLGKILADENLIRAGEDWLTKAESLTLKHLQMEVNARMKEVYEGGPTSVLTTVMTADGRSKFERAREVACEKEQKILDEGQTIEVLSDFYLDAFDEDRKTPRARRAPDTTGRNGRHVPAEVRRAIRERATQHGKVFCEVEGCESCMFLQLAHVEAHRFGGSRELDNLILLCPTHHAMFDGGWLGIERNGRGFRFKVRGPPD